MNTLMLFASVAFPAPLAAALHTQDAATPIHYKAFYSVQQLNIEASVMADKNNQLTLEINKQQSYGESDDFDKHRQDFTNALQDGIWCDTVHRLIKPGSLHTIKQSDKAYVYQFQRMAADPNDNDERSYAAVTRGEIAVIQDSGRWRIEKIAWRLSRPLERFLVVKIPRIDITIQCAQSPSGRSYQAKTETFVKGKAFGRSIDNHSVMIITDLNELENMAKY